MSEDKSNAPFSEKDLKKFLSTRTILIFSSSLATARTLRKILVQYGANADRVQPFDRFEDAKSFLFSQSTHILISDLFHEQKSGLELVEVQQKNFPNRLEVASVMVCADPSDSSVGMMAEANIDGILMRPFNFINVKAVMDQALANKVNPNQYWQNIENGKGHFLKKEYELAIPLFEEAKNADPSPLLAYYYLGLIHQEKQEFEQALTSFEEGLKFDPKNFLCLIAIFDFKMNRAEYESAYEVATRLHKHHPVSTTRILSLVKLSVYNKKFTDILDYYQIFKQIKNRDAILNRAVIASMLVCAKHFALKAEKVKNLEVLKDAATIANETETLRAEVFRYFIESHHYDDADIFHRDFPEEFRNNPEIRLLNLGLNHASGQDSAVIQLGKLMIKEGVKSPRVFELMIDSSKRLKRSEDRIDEIIQEAKMYYPNDF